jgi:hypothetical protein
MSWRRMVGVRYTYLFTYLRCWSLLEKLPIVQPLKNFPAFYATRRLVTIFTRALHWPLSSARSIQSIPSNPLSLRSSSTNFWSRHWMEVSGQLHAQSSLPPRNPSDRRLGGLQCPSGRCGEETNLALPGIEPGPVAIPTEPPRHQEPRSV